MLMMALFKYGIKNFKDGRTDNLFQRGTRLEFLQSQRIGFQKSHAKKLLNTILYFTIEKNYVLISIVETECPRRFMQIVLLSSHLEENLLFQAFSFGFL